jgi:uncharacterized membrane protein
MLEILVIVLGVIFYVSVSNRLKKLEDKVYGPITFSGVAQQTNQNIPPQPMAPNQTELAAEAQAVAMSQSQSMANGYGNQVNSSMMGENAVEKFFSWLAEEWPLKVGIFLLILAVGWFVTYAFINDWIGEVGRVSLGVIFGIVLLVIGFFRAATHRLQGNALLVLGSTAILISIISGIGLYDMFPAAVALVVAFALVVFMTLVALQQNNRALGVMTLLMGAIVPMFVFSEIDISITFLYLFVLTAGTLWVTSKTAWNALNIMALVVVFLYSVAYNSFAGFDSNFQNLVFAFVFVFLFYFSNIFTILYKRTADTADLVVAGGTGILFLTWMMMIAPKDLEVYLIVFGALLFSLGAYAIFVITKAKNPVILYAGVALMLLVSATAIQFKGWELVIAYIVEFSAFIMINLYLNRQEEGVLAISETFGMILYVVLFLLSLTHIEKIFEHLNGSNYSYGNISKTSLITGDLFVIFLLCIMPFVITIFVTQLFERSKKVNYVVLVRFYGLTGGFYATLFVWMMTHLMVADQMLATMLSLVIYTIIGVLFYVRGRRDNYGFFKAIGGIFFAIVLFRLFFVEFWAMDIVGKIVTFFIVGTLFISTTFIGRKGENNSGEIK